jgi:hypothetical protein
MPSALFYMLTTKQIPFHFPVVMYSVWLKYNITALARSQSNACVGYTWFVKTVTLCGFARHGATFTEGNPCGWEGGDSVSDENMKL